VLGRVLEVLGVLGGVFWRWRECFGGFRSVRKNVLEVLKVFGGVFWTF